MEAWASPRPFGPWWYALLGVLVVVGAVQATLGLLGEASPWLIPLGLAQAFLAVVMMRTGNTPATRIDGEGIRVLASGRVERIPWARVDGDVRYEIPHQSVTVGLIDGTRFALPATKREHEDLVARLIERGIARRA